MKNHVNVKKNILGLDLGIASVGWCCVDAENKSIIASGVRTFDRMENPKNKESLNTERRERRLARRRLKRRRQRLQECKKLFRKRNFPPEEIAWLGNVASRYEDPKNNPWELRVKALKKKLNSKEILILLYYFMKHRGFLSNKKADTKDKETGKVLNAKKDIDNTMQTGRYQTLGELAADKYVPHKRNKSDDYRQTPFRTLLKEEIKIIFENQREYGNHALLSESFEEEYLDLFYTQKPIQDVINQVGKCTHEPEERRAPQLAPSVEKFVLFQTLNNIRLVDYEEQPLSPEQKKKIVDYFFPSQEKSNQKTKISYKEVRKMFALEPHIRFKGVDHETEGKDKLSFEIKGFPSIKELVKKSDVLKWEAIKDDFVLLDCIAEAATYRKSDKTIKDHLEREDITDPNIIDIAKKLDFKEVGRLSLKAIRKLIPYLEEGLDYYKACLKVGYDPDGLRQWKPEKGLLPVIDRKDPKAEALDLNPIVYRGVTQARKVVNEIIRKYGTPEKIHIELARDLGKGIKTRNQIEKEQDKSRSAKEKAKKAFEELFGRSPKDEELIKYRLWRECQDETCMYSYPIKKISCEDLRKDIEGGNLLEVDHIIPKSRVYDDSFQNKVLCYTDENRNKGNQTPYEFFGSQEKRWGKFETFVNGLHKNKKINGAKKRRLLIKELNEDEWISRNLNDTRYISKFVKTYLECLYSDQEDTKKHVIATSGRVTSWIRKEWEYVLRSTADTSFKEVFVKDRGKGDRHHAIDAAVIACTDDRMINRITRYEQENEEWKKHKYTKDDKNKKPKFPMPWPGFEKDLTEKMQHIFVSRMIKKRRRGKAHAETLYSWKNESKSAFLRRPLKDLKKGEWEYLTKESSLKRETEAIRKRLLDKEFNPDNLGKNDFKKAFSLPKSEEGTQGIQAVPFQKIRVKTGVKSGVGITDKRTGKYLGIMERENMLRIDIYAVSHKKEKKYYGVPIYVADIGKPMLPNKAAKVNTIQEDWPEMDRENFMMSLYQGDLVEFTKKDNETKQLYLYRAYYNNFTISTGSINIKGHDQYHIHRKPYDPDKSYEDNIKSHPWEEIALNKIGNYKDGVMTSIGIQKLKVFEKFQVGLLGDIHKVNNHRLLPLRHNQEL